MLIYNLTKYSNSYSKTFRYLYQFCRCEPKKTNVKVSKLLNFQSKVLDNTNSEGFITAKIAVSLKYLRNFWRTLEMLLINCKINLI